MPRIKSEDRVCTGLYHELRTASNGRNEKNDCAVLAVSVACKVSYEIAHKALEAFGREPGMGTSYTKIRRAIGVLGKRITVHNCKDFIARYPQAHRILKSVTTHHPARFNKVWRDGKAYILCLKANHVAAVLNGELHDWSAGRALQAFAIWEIHDN